jgi:PRTRC genetic system protein A
MLPSDKAYIYVMAGNGLFKFAENQQIRAVIPVASAEVAGLPALSVSVQPKFGRVPETILDRILSDARQQASDGPREAMYHISLKGDRIRVFRPPQLAGNANVNYAGGGDAAIFCDLHSHCRMNPYFSPTDNEDELGFRFYSVIGSIHDTPEIRVRVGVYGDFYPVPATALFTGTGPFRDISETGICNAHQKTL